MVWDVTRWYLQLEASGMKVEALLNRIDAKLKEVHFFLRLFQKETQKPTSRKEPRAMYYRNALLSAGLSVYSLCEGVADEDNVPFVSKWKDALAEQQRAFFESIERPRSLGECEDFVAALETLVDFIKTFNF